jgi:hypothetical protein
MAGGTPAIAIISLVYGNQAERRQQGAGSRHGDPSSTETSAALAAHEFALDMRFTGTYISSPDRTIGFP